MNVVDFLYIVFVLHATKSFQSATCLASYSCDLRPIASVIGAHIAGSGPVCTDK